MEKLPYKNRIVIIGNGFDLAHGYRTSYMDFLNDYIRKVIRFYYSAQGPINEPQLFSVKFKHKPEGFMNQIDKAENLERVLDLCQLNGVHVSGISTFAKKILESVEKKWVDIEALYYDELKRLAVGNSELNIRAVEILNKQFELLKTELVSYLNSLDYLPKPIEQLWEQYVDIVSKDIGLPPKGLMFQGKSTSPVYGKILLLNFNYTGTANEYRKIFDEHLAFVDVTCINIHGGLNPEDIIFGYGDDSTDDYRELENHNLMDVLVNMKSSWYSKTQRYKLLFNFIKDEPFQLQIFGHSCGLSDRTLLKNIFEDDNCREIQIFFHSRKDGSDDHFEKSIDISRHFSNKHTFRTKLLGRDFSSPLPQYTR